MECGKDSGRGVDDIVKEIVTEMLSELFDKPEDPVFTADV